MTHLVNEQRGSGTVLGLLLIVVGLLGFAVVLVFVAATQAATRAGTAADLAALVAADTARGLRPGDPCTAAATLATSNGARLIGCTVEATADAVQIHVLVPARFSFADFTIYEAAASARAGAPPLDQR